MSSVCDESVMLLSLFLLVLLLSRLARYFVPFHVLQVLATLPRFLLRSD
jgi:hypothetical protein